MIKKKTRAKQSKVGATASIKIKDYSTSYGSMNKVECRAVYLHINSYVIPDNEYRRDTEHFKDEIERNINKVIRKEFDGIKTHILWSIETRNTNCYDRLNQQFTLLPIEGTILFNENIDYYLYKEKYESILSRIVDYLGSYNGLLFAPKIIK